MNQRLINKLNNYQPNQSVIEVIKNTEIVLLCGIAGAGKDTIKQELLKTGKFHHIISHTTREKRQNNGVWEQDGVEYNFVSFDQIEQMLDNHQFVEAKKVHDNVYGTSIAQFEMAQKLNKIATTDIDYQGAMEYKKNNPKTKIIFILPPDFETWVKRLKNRYQDQQEFGYEFAKRTKTAIEELKFALNNENFEFIINDTVENAVNQITAIITKKAHKNNYQDKINQLLEQIKSNC